MGIQCERPMECMNEQELGRDVLVPYENLNRHPDNFFTILKDPSKKILFRKQSPENSDNHDKYFNTEGDSVPSDDFSRYIFDHINEIRQNPQYFIQDIEEGKKKITQDNMGRLIFRSNLKVALFQGEEAFDEAIEVLRNTEPMQPLIYKSTLNIPIPSDAECIKDRHYLKEQVGIMNQNKLNVKSFWRDLIKDPEISFLLMIVDDSGNKAGMKRADILDPNMKYMGICSDFVRGKFVCYMTFSEGN